MEARDAMHQISNQSWVMRKMGMQMIYFFTGPLFRDNKKVNKVNSL